MRFHLNIAISIILSLSCNIVFANSDNTYKVLKVIDGDTVYLDFNNDGQFQPDEKVRINWIDTFETKPGEFLDWQAKEYGLTQDEALGLGYLGKEFAKKYLLGKYVRAEYTGDTQYCDMGRHLMSIWYDNKNYGKKS